MTFEEQLQMMEDYLNYSDDVVEAIPQWYIDWWTENHRKEITDG